MSGIPGVFDTPNVVQAKFNSQGFDFKCPVCFEKVEVNVSVEIIPGAMVVHKDVIKDNGSVALHPDHEVRLNTKIRGAQINHSCLTEGTKPVGREARNNG